MNVPDEIMKLAKSLKDNGLAASMQDAIERAKNMIGKPKEKPEVKQ